MANSEIEQRLRVAEERFQQLFDATPDAMITVGSDGCILLVNAQAERLFGYSRDELVGRSINALMPARHRAAHPTQQAEYLHAPRARRMGAREVSALRKDGTEFPAEISLSPTDSGSSVTASIRDVSDRRRAEEAHRQTTEQLRHAQKMEAIGVLAGGVAHDFNNLLSVILTYSSLLLDQLKESDPLRTDVDEIRKAGERAAALTRQLLAFSRQQVVAPKVVDLNQVLGGVEKMLQRILGEDVELSLLAAPSLGTIRADPGQIEQVVMNLAVNARDAMPTGGKLTLETENVELDAAFVTEHYGVAPGPYAMLAVTDTGIGMDSTTRARIFEPFFTTKPAGKGTGLGLATVFGIVRQSGGTIWVYSEPGKGTTFKVYFPRAEGRTEIVAHVPHAPRTLRGSETILLVEDEEAVRVVVRSVLRRHGYNVLEAQNGGEAFLICEQFGAKINLLLTDVVMPRMSGPALADRLAGMRPEMRVLFMSGFTDNAVVHHGVLDAGMAFVQKPLTPSLLLHKVREVLDRAAE